MADGLTGLEELYNKLVKSGTGALGGVNTSQQAESGLASAVRSFLEKSVKDSPDGKQYVEQLSKELAKAIVRSEPVAVALRGAQQVLTDLASYLESRLLIAPRIQTSAQTVAGQTVSPPRLALVQSAVTSDAVKARDLDEAFRTKVAQKFSLNPGVVLDPTVRFVQKVDASYQVTITSVDVTVKLSSGFTIQRPLTSHATADVSVGAEASSGALTAYVRGTTSLDDLNSRVHVSKSGVTAGLGWQIAPQASVNVDYHMNTSYGARQRPEQGVFVGIKILF